MVLHGNDQVEEEDIRDVGKMLGVYCENNFQVLSRGGVRRQWGRRERKRGE